MALDGGGPCKRLGDRRQPPIRQRRTVSRNQEKKRGFLLIPRQYYGLHGKLVDKQGIKIVL